MAKNATKPNEAAENTAPEEMASVNTQQTEAAASGKPPEKATPPNRKAPIHVYVGPSLPGGLLKINTVLNGSLEEIKDYYKPLLEGFPEIKYATLEKMIIPLDRLAKSRENIGKTGNIMHKYYSDIEGMIQEARNRIAGNGGSK